MKLYEYLDVEKLGQHIRDGIVEVRNHNTLPLSILCYSKKANFDQVWDDVTCRTRGLIVTGDKVASESEIIARPFEKFFNLNHAGRPETDLLTLLEGQSYPPVFSEKLDGSMGTFWKYAGQCGIATKGSFHSEQAEWATKWLSEHGPRGAWPVGFTPVFEIIAQSVQHHVVHYLPHEDNRLVLIGLANNETGAEMEPELMATWAKINGIDIVDTWRDLSIFEAMQDRPDKEGYIATWYRNGTVPFRVKIKHETFLKLQKIAHHTTPKTIFQALRNGDEAMIQEALSFGSPYLEDRVKEWVKVFNDEHERILKEARELFKNALECTTDRREFAQFVINFNKTLAPCAFNLLDEKPMRLNDTAWDLAEPIVKTIKFEEVEEEG